jgi:hypothetical protein
LDERLVAPPAADLGDHVALALCLKGPARGYLRRRFFPNDQERGRRFTMKDAGIRRASERVTLACKALSAAADDLAVAARRDGLLVDETVRSLEVERERVCELAEELSNRARSLGMLARAVA